MRRLLLLLFAMVLAAPGARGERVFPARAPAGHAKSVAIAALRLDASAAASVGLPALDTAAIASMQRENRANGMRALKLGVVREAPQAAPRSGALAWREVEGGRAAQWRVSVDGARALRIELAIAHAPRGATVRYAPASDPSRAIEAALPASGRAWSPVIAGDAIVVELFAPGASAAALSVSLARIADHIADPSHAGFEKDASGDAAGSCEVDFACAASGDEALDRAGSSVARMTYVSDGYVWACTGTLLNSGDGSFAPYFYTAAHCVHDEEAAASVATLWFYQQSTCGSDGSVSGVQLSGGAQLLVTDKARDATLLRLNDTPPEGAVYSGWDSSPIDPGMEGVGIHHPGGGVKKVSEGVAAYNPADDFLRVTWSMGVTESGSSGSGLFTEAAGPRRDYLLRGTLYGGVSACTGAPPNAFDVYSRFDRAWPALAPYLSAQHGAANHSGLWADPAEPGWGLSLDEEQGVVVATLFSYGADGNPAWLSASALLEESADTYSGVLYRTSGPAFDAREWSGASAVPVGRMSVAFNGARSATVTYIVDGSTVTKALEPIAFGPGGPAACRLTSESRAGDRNYQGLWWNPAQSGWGLALAHQGDVLFAVLFVYDGSGQARWLVASDVRDDGEGGYAGTLYRTRGAAPGAGPWSPVAVSAAGTLSVRFADGENGSLSYTLDGKTVTAPIARFAAAAQTPTCR